MRPSAWISKPPTVCAPAPRLTPSISVSAVTGVFPSISTIRVVVAAGAAPAGGGGGGHRPETFPPRTVWGEGGGGLGREAAPRGPPGWRGAAPSPRAGGDPKPPARGRRPPSHGSQPAPPYRRSRAARPTWCGSTPHAAE